MQKARTPPSLTTLVLLTAVSTLALNMFLPSLANIATDLDADYATTSLAVAGFLAVTAIIQLVVGPLSDRIGRRPVLLGSLAVFMFASIGCAMAQNVWTFLFFRLLQGGMIAGHALSLAIVRDTTSEEKAAGLIGYISMAMAVAPMLGPMLGGVLDASFGWRANFYFYALAGLTLLLLCWVDLGETRPQKPDGGDPTGETAKDLLGEPLFWAYSATGMFSVGAFYIFLTGAPLVARLEFGLGPAELGLFIGTITGGFMFGGFLSGRFAESFGPEKLILAGRASACLGTSVGIVLFFAGPQSHLVLFTCTVFVGIGNGLTVPGASAAALSVRPKLAGTAAGYSGALMVAGGAALTTLTGVVLSSSATSLTLLILMFGSSFAALLTILLAIGIRRNAGSQGNMP